jgi:hypothetical protein
MEPQLRKGVDKCFGYCIDEDFLTTISYEQCRKIFGRKPKAGTSMVIEVKTRKIKKVKNGLE